MRGEYLDIPHNIRVPVQKLKFFWTGRECYGGCQGIYRSGNKLSVSEIQNLNLTYTYRATMFS